MDKTIRLRNEVKEQLQFKVFRQLKKEFPNFKPKLFEEDFEASLKHSRTRLRIFLNCACAGNITAALFMLFLHQ